MRHRISVLTGVLFLTSVGLAGNASAQMQEPLAENTANMVQIGLANKLKSILLVHRLKKTGNLNCVPLAFILLVT